MEVYCDVKDFRTVLLYYPRHWKQSEAITRQRVLCSVFRSLRTEVFKQRERACGWRQAPCWHSQQSYINTLVWIQTSVFRVSSLIIYDTHHFRVLSAVDSFEWKFNCETLSGSPPNTLPPAESYPGINPPELRVSVGGGCSTKNCCLLKQRSFWHHYLLVQTQPLLIGGKVSLIEPHIICCQCATS